MTAPTPAAGGAGVDELLDPSFLDGVQELPMAEVRALRHRAEQEEVNLSYTRRLLQGRLDIVRRELQRRAEHDGRSLVDLLPEILSEKGRGPAHGPSPPGSPAAGRPASARRARPGAATRGARCPAGPAAVAGCRRG